MNERRYTVTEGRLRELMTGARLPMFLTEGYFHGLLSTLTPDPEPSGEVVERIRKAMGCIWLDGDTMGASIQGEEQAVKNLSALLTAEVTRQVEERTQPAIEWAEDLVKWSEAYPTTIFTEPTPEQIDAVCKSLGFRIDRISAMVLREFTKSWGDKARAFLACQALANKGGSD